MYTMINDKPVNIGVAFGYCYHPQVLGSSSLMSFSPSCDGRSWKYHPFFEAQEEAERWLRDRGLAGKVLRYAHHKAAENRGEDIDLGSPPVLLPQSKVNR